MSTQVHVFPVPRGYTADQAWDEIQCFGTLHRYRWWKPRFWRCHWAIREVKR